MGIFQAYSLGLRNDSLEDAHLALVKRPTQPMTSTAPTPRTFPALALNSAVGPRTPSAQVSLRLPFPGGRSKLSGFLPTNAQSSQLVILRLRHSPSTRQHRHPP